MSQRSCAEPCIPVDRPDPTQILHRHIGRPASTWTVDDLVRMFRERDLHVLSLMHVGGDGWLKTLDFVPRDAVHLADVLAGGERADGSSLFGNLGLPAGVSDIVIRPRISTAFIDPFSTEPALAVLCSHFNGHGEPLNNWVEFERSSSCMPLVRSSFSWASTARPPSRMALPSAAIRPVRRCSASRSGGKP